MGEYIVIALVALAAGLAIRSIWKGRKKGSCCGDCSQCHSCGK